MTDTDAPGTSPPDKTWSRWNDEWRTARKAKGYDTWLSRAKRIVERYRDERPVNLNPTVDGSLGYNARFNILWSNTQTLLPALFAKTPKPVVERRYLDRDDVGRTASVILERALTYELDGGGYAASLRKCVLDRLLAGRGVAWVRYQPTFANMPSKTQETGEEAQKDPADDPDEEVAYECVAVDYIDWRDFMTNSARVWEEVKWVDKRVYMTRKELVDRFGEIGKSVPLDWSPESDNENEKSGVGESGVTSGRNKRAKIHETWDKENRKVFWWAENWSEKMLDEQDDPLRLEGFFPCPKPLFASLTNETLVPIPDYTEYQDQAAELDNLTARITALLQCIKATGIYDASIPELGRMFTESFENKLVPTDMMSEFVQKAGPDGGGVIWMLPIKEMAETLQILYLSREQTKQSLYEITGISDIVRGQAGTGKGQAPTATEQRIKGQFASMRLNDMQAEVARFSRDVLRLMGEIISEHYKPETLMLISGFEQYAKEQWPAEPVEPPPQQPGMPPPDPQQMQMMQQQADMQAQMKAQQMFAEALALLRNDKLRGFRIDIETDSLVEPDQQATQQARSELMGAISQFLPQAIEAGQAMPQLRPLLARLLMFFLRGFKASRDIEAAFEQFIDDLTKDAQNPKPPPPSPEQIKAQAEMQKQQAETQRMQMQAQIDQQKAQMDIQVQQQKNQIDMERMQMELQIKREELELKRQEMGLKAQMAQQDMQIKQQQGQMELANSQQQASIENEQMQRQAEMSEAEDARAVEAGEQKHEQTLEVMDAKAKQAKAAAAMKPKAKE